MPLVARRWVIGVAASAVAVLVVLPLVWPGFPWVWPGGHPYFYGGVPRLLMEAGGEIQPGSWKSEGMPGPLGLGTEGTLGIGPPMGPEFEVAEGEEVVFSLSEVGWPPTGWRLRYNPNGGTVDIGDFPGGSQLAWVVELPEGRYALRAEAMWGPWGTTYQWSMRVVERP